MINRAILQFIPLDTQKMDITNKIGYRIYLRNGEVVNSIVDEMVTGNLDMLKLKRIRQTGKGNRNLLPSFAEEA